jgi:hypothetical protein
MRITQIPLLVFILIAYNLLAYTMADIGAPLFALTLFSGAVWNISMGDILIVAGLVLLYLEIIKSTHTGRTAALDHTMSMGVLVVCILEFVLVRVCGTSTFFLITLLAAFDVLAGFHVSIASARRDIDIERVTDGT